MNQLPNSIRIIYFDSVDGPQLLLYGPIDIELDKLQLCLNRLRSGAGAIELTEEPFVASRGGVKLFLTAIDDPAGGRQHSISSGIRKDDSSGTAFHWTQTKMEWDDTVDLIEGLRSSPFPGHQYLYPRATDDAIVVISKGEYTDKDFK